MRVSNGPGGYDPINGDTGNLFPPAGAGRVAPAVMPRQPLLPGDPLSQRPLMVDGPGGAPSPMDDMNPDVRNGIAQLLQRQIMTARGQ